MNALKKLGQGWKAEGDNYRYDIDNVTFLRAIKVEKGWVGARFETRNGEACGVGGMFFTSLKKLVEHLESDK